MLLSHDEPCGKRAAEAEAGGQHGGPLVLLRPEQGQGGGEDGAGDDDTHHEVDEAEGDAGVIEAGGEGGHDETEGDDHHMGHVDQAAA